MPHRLTRIIARLLCLLLPALLCGCIAYRPRLLSYEATSTPTGEPTASVTVMGEGVRVQAKAGDTWQVLKTGDKIFVGSLLMTDGSSEAVVELPGGHGQISVCGKVRQRPTGSSGQQFQQVQRPVQCLHGVLVRLVGKRLRAATGARFGGHFFSRHAGAVAR